MKRMRWLSFLLALLLAIVSTVANSPAASALPLTEEDANPADITATLQLRASDPNVTPASIDVPENSNLTEILVKFRPDAGPDAMADLVCQNGDTVIDTIQGIGAQIVQVPAGEIMERLASYTGSPLVEYAEPNYPIEAIVFPADAPNDPYFDLQWGLEKIKAQQAWGVTRGSSGTVIAVLDSGIDQDHPDLSSKIMANKNFTVSSTVDDLDGHGTHVAGVAAAITNNGLGVAGVAPNCRLMNVKVLNDQGFGSVGAAVNGIIWATNGPDGNPYTDDGADVINMSFVTGAPSSSLQAAVAYAWKHGVVLVAGAGNYYDTDPCYPARYPECIAVAACGTTDDGSLLYFSTRGDWVEVAAPGSGIYTTSTGGSYGKGTGTSIASPHVAGLAALVLSTVTDVNGNGSLNDEAKYAIESTCALAADIRYGAINAYGAVTANVPSLGFISGTVTDAVTGAPVYPDYGAIVTDGTREAFTGSTGRYTIYGVPAGTYTVTVSAMGYLSQSKTVTVLPGRTALANFSLAVSPGGAIAGVVTDTSSRPVAGATVTDGSRRATTATDGRYYLADVPEGNYTVTASAPGYLPTVMAAIVYRGVTTTKNFVLYPDSTERLEVEFSATPYSGVEPLLVAFRDLSSSPDGIVSWLWDFGDGSSSRLQNPTHRYVQDGTYTARLTVTEADGDRDTRAHYITVQDTSPQVAFSAAPLSELQPLTMVFTDGSSSYDGIASWLWDFGDGTSSTARNPQHTYGRAGLYNVTLTVTDADGSRNSTWQALQVSVASTTVTVTLDGKPVEGYRVYAFTATGVYTRISRVTGVTGQAVFYLTEGSYKFRVYCSGDYWWSPVVTAPGSSTIDIRTDDTPVDTVVTVTAGGSPLVGYRVFGYTATGRYTGKSAVTNTSGQAVFGLPQGDYKFKVYYAGAWHWSSPVSTPGATTISIPGDGGTADTVVTVTAGGSPLAGYTVYACTSTGLYTGKSAVTNTSGQAFLGLAEGSYKFKVYYAGAWHWSPVVTTPAETTISIPADDTPADTVVTVTAEGSPLEGYRVYAYTATGVYTGKSSVTNTSGQATFDLSGGSYKFKVYYAGAYWWSPAISTPGATTISIPAVGTPADTVVTVTTAGRPLVGYRVFAYTGTGVYAGKSGVTNASGQAVFDLPQGSYKFKVYYAGAWRWSPVVSTPATTYIRIP